MNRYIHAWGSALTAQDQMGHILMYNSTFCDAGSALQSCWQVGLLAESQGSSLVLLRLSLIASVLIWWEFLTSIYIQLKKQNCIFRSIEESKGCEHLHFMFSKMRKLWAALSRRGPHRSSWDHFKSSVSFLGILFYVCISNWTLWVFIAEQDRKISLKKELLKLYTSLVLSYIFTQPHTTFS